MFYTCMLMNRDILLDLSFLPGLAAPPQTTAFSNLFSQNQICGCSLDSPLRARRGHNILLDQNQTPEV